MRNANCLFCGCIWCMTSWPFQNAGVFKNLHSGESFWTPKFLVPEKTFSCRGKAKTKIKTPFQKYPVDGDKEWQLRFFLDSVSYVGGVAFGKDIGPERTPLSTSSRTVAYVFSCLALIIINTYCANLTAFLLVETDHFPITGVNDPKVGSIV